MCPIVAPSTPHLHKMVEAFSSEPVLFYRKWGCSGSPSNSDGDQYYNMQVLCKFCGPVVGPQGQHLVSLKLIVEIRTQATPQGLCYVGSVSVGVVHVLCARAHARASIVWHSSHTAACNPLTTFFVAFWCAPKTCQNGGVFTFFLKLSEHKAP